MLSHQKMLLIISIDTVIVHVIIFSELIIKSGINLKR